MKKQGAKRGRPPGSYRYAAEDRAALEHMYVLWKQGKPVGPKAIAREKSLRLLPSPERAADRLRKQFRRFREEKEKASRSTRPAQSGNIPLAQMVNQARQVVKFLGPSGVKDIKGKVSSVRENRASILETAKLARRSRKPKI